MLRPKVLTAQKPKNFLAVKQETPEKADRPATIGQKRLDSFRQNLDMSYLFGRPNTSVPKTPQSSRDPMRSYYISPFKVKPGDSSPITDRSVRRPNREQRSVDAKKKNLFSIRDVDKLNKTQNGAAGIIPFSTDSNSPQKVGASSLRPKRAQTMEAANESALRSILFSFKNNRKNTLNESAIDKPGVKLKLVSPERRAEIMKVVKRIHPLEKTIRSSISSLREDFVVILKSDFSILGISERPPHLEGFKDIRDVYFAMELELFQDLLEAIDKKWFDLSYALDAPLRTESSMKKRRNARGDFPELSLTLFADNFKEAEEKVDLRTEDDDNDTMYITGSMFSTAYMSKTNKFDDMYSTFYKTTFGTEVESSVKNLNKRMRLSPKYKPPIGKPKVDCKQSTVVKSKVYADYSDMQDVDATPKVLSAVQSILNFSLNHVTLCLTLLHTAKYLLQNGQPESCLKWLQLAINIGMLFKCSPVLVHTYKVLGDYYLSLRDFEKAQFAYTKCVNHGLHSNDSKMLLLMYDMIGSLR